MMKTMISKDSAHASQKPLHSPSDLSPTGCRGVNYPLLDSIKISYLTINHLINTYQSP